MTPDAAFTSSVSATGSNLAAKEVHYHLFFSLLLLPVYLPTGLQNKFQNISPGAFNY